MCILAPAPLSLKCRDPMKQICVGLCTLCMCVLQSLRAEKNMKKKILPPHTHFSNLPQNRGLPPMFYSARLFLLLPESYPSIMIHRNQVEAPGCFMKTVWEASAAPQNPRDQTPKFYEDRCEFIPSCPQLSGQNPSKKCGPREPQILIRDIL